MFIFVFLYLGAGVLLHNNATGYFLGDVKWGDNNMYVGFGLIMKENSPTTRTSNNNSNNNKNDDSSNNIGNNGLLVDPVYGRICVVKKEHIKSFYEPEESIPSRYAKDMLDVLSLITIWKEIPFDDYWNNLNTNNSNANNNNNDKNNIELTQSGSKSNKRSSILLGAITGSITRKQDKIAKALEVINQSRNFPIPELPGSIIRQRQLIQEIELEYRNHPIVLNNDQESIINALRYVSQLKDPIGFVSDKSITNNNPTSNNDKDGATGNKKYIAGMGSTSSTGEKEVYAWTMFNNVIKILKSYDAVDENFKPTSLGRFIGSFSGDNELWAALALRTENIKSLNAPELAGKCTCACYSMSLCV